jgi:hypothetical protein
MAVLAKGHGQFDHLPISLHRRVTLTTRDLGLEVPLTWAPEPDDDIHTEAIGAQKP